MAYVFLFVIIGALYLFVRCFYERRRRHGHAKAGKFEDQHVPKTILGIHAAVTCLALLLTLITTAGYIAACENLHDIVRLVKTSFHKSTKVVVLIILRTLFFARLKQLEHVENEDFVRLVQMGVESVSFRMIPCLHDASFVGAVKKDL